MSGKSYLENFLFLCFLLIIAARFFFPLNFISPFHLMENDPFRHWQNATRLFEITMDGAIDPLFYQVYLFIIQTISGIGDYNTDTTGKFIINVFTGILCASVPWLWYKCCREFFSQHMSFLAAILIGTNPIILNIYGYFMNETLLLSLMALGMWLSFRAYRKKTVLSFSVAVFVLMAASLTRIIALPIAIVWIAILIAFFPDKIKRAIIAGVISALLIIPAGYHAYRALNVFAPFGFPMINAIYKKSNKLHFNVTMKNTENGLQIRQYASPSYFNSSPFRPFMDYKTRKPDEVFKYEVDVEGGIFHWNKVYDELEETPQQIRDGYFENFIFLFFGPSWPYNYGAMLHHYDDDIAAIQFHYRWIWFPMTCVIVLYAPFIRNSRRQQIFVWLTLMLIGGMLVQNMNVMDGRYRMPLEPMIVISFLIAITQAINTYKARGPYLSLSSPGTKPPKGRPAKR